MAYFKKRRGPQGPNKNEEKVLRAQRAENQARLTQVLGARFPSVKKLRAVLRLLDARQNPLEEKTIALNAVDRPDFTHPCPGRCGRGVFDFGLKIADAVAAATPVLEFSVKCPETLMAGSTEACGVELRARIELDLIPMERPAA